jgi:putative ABC transport system permease protein
VRRTFVLESGLLAVEGLVIGAVLALVAGYQLVSNAEVFGDADVAFSVPWSELALLIAGAAAASVACALPSASRAARTPPAVGLRRIA